MEHEDGRRYETRADRRRALEQQRSAARRGSRRATAPVARPRGATRLERRAGGATRSARLSHREAKRASLRRRLLQVGGGAMALAVTAGLAVTVHLNGNIERVDIGQGSAARPTAAVEGALNILVIGSDTREGIGTTEYGVGTAEGGARSDTNLLVHLSSDRKSAYVVSIPRDSMTKAPTDCSDPASTVDNGEVRRWNDNFNRGGPACTVKTLEGLTGVFVDHVAVIDFSGFQAMVDGLGGVDVCLPQAVHDEDAQIDLPAGRQRLEGKDALGYVRMRKSLGDGSDLQRIERQQAFMSSMAQEVTDTSLLLRPDRLYSFLDAATRSMTADDDLGLTRLMSIASSLKELGTDEIVFVTVPTEPYPADTNRVQWRSEASEALWAAVRADTALPGRDPKRPAKRERELTVVPSAVSVSVVNDTVVSGLARQEAAALTAQGFDASVVRTPPTGTVSGVFVHHAKGDEQHARTVAAAYPGAKLKVDETLAEGDVRLVFGAGADPAREVPNSEADGPLPSPSVTAPPAATDVATRTASEDICG